MKALDCQPVESNIPFKVLVSDVNLHPLQFEKEVEAEMPPFKIENWIAEHDVTMIRKKTFIQVGKHMQKLGHTMVAELLIEVKGEERKGERERAFIIRRALSSRICAPFYLVVLPLVINRRFLS